MRIIDVVFAFPSILLALVFISLLGPGKGNVIISLGIAFIPSFARIVRSEFIRCREMDYVKLAKLAGAGDLRVMFVHILLGIGVQPPEASLGRMLSEAQTFLFSSPGFAVFPGIFIVLMVLGFSLLSEGLKEMQD